MSGKSRNNSSITQVSPYAVFLKPQEPEEQKQNYTFVREEKKTLRLHGCKKEELFFQFYFGKLEKLMSIFISFRGTTLAL